MGTIVGGVLVGVLCLILLSTIIVVCVWFGRKKVAEQQAFKGKNIIIQNMSRSMYGLKNDIVVVVWGGGGGGGGGGWGEVKWHRGVFNSFPLPLYTC